MKSYAENGITLSENKIKDFIGANDGIEGDFGAIYWKEQKGRRSVSYKNACIEADVPAEIIERNTSYGEPKRVLNTKKLKPAPSVENFLQEKEADNG